MIAAPPVDATEYVSRACELRISTAEMTGALGTVYGAMRTDSLSVPEPAAFTARIFTE